MKLSIIIPIYNAQKYLRECLETVSVCPCAQMECILVNDGSIDTSLQICEEFVQKDPRFRVINKKNEGVSVARNTGISHASGDYIFFLDADDYIDVGKWGVILKAAEEQYDFTAFSYYTLWDNGTIEEELYPIVGNEATDVDTARKLVLASASLNTCWGKLLRRSIIEDNGIMFKKGVKTGEDALFILDYFQKAHTYAIRNECIIYYRQHVSSAMHQINMDNRLGDFQAIYDYRKRLSQLWQDSELEKEMYRQFFSVITDMFLKYSSGGNYRKVRRAFLDTGKKTIVQEIIGGTPYERLTPVYKKLEYQLMKRRMFGCLTLYFKLKNQFRRTGSK